MRFSPHDPRIIYLHDSPDGGYARSMDGGLTWLRGPDDLREAVDLVMDPIHPGVYFVVGRDRLERWVDGQPVKLLHVRPAGKGSVAVSAIRPGLIIVSESYQGGLQVSRDMGDTWEREQPLPFSAARMTFDGLDPDVLYAVSPYGTIRRKLD